MNLKKTTYFIISAAAVCLLLFPSLFGQMPRKGSKVKLHYADSLIGKKTESGEIRSLYGNVWLSQDRVNIFADFGRQFLLSNNSVLRGNVRVEQKSMIMRADSGKYYGFSREVEGKGGISIVDSTGTVLTAEKGRYDINAEKAVFKTGVTVENDSVLLLGDKITYYRITQNTYANENVALYYKKMNLLITCDSAEYLPEKEYASASGLPDLYKIDTTFDDQGQIETFDTMHIVSAKMESFENNEFVFSEYVRIYRSNVTASCRQARYFNNEELITLSGKPAIWFEDTQVSADTIALFLENGAIAAVYAQGNAISMSEGDSVFTARINQISGDTLRVDFKKKKVEMITGKGAAKSLYFVADEKGLTGVDRTSSDSIKVYFEKGEPVKINWLGQSEKDFIEPLQTVDNEKYFYLPAFDPRTKPESYGILEFRCE